MNTKRTWQVFIVVVIGLFLAVAPLFAEEPIDDSEYPYCCQENWSNGRRGRYINFDGGKVETLDGKVISVDANPSRRGNFQGTHLMVNTNKETIEIHVAPSWYLAEQEFEISPQDNLTIKGSRIKVDGEEAIIAREIIKGDKTLVLRDENGIPMWRGQRRSGQR